VQRVFHETATIRPVFAATSHGIEYPCAQAIYLQAVNTTMGFEQLAELRDRLRAEKAPAQADSAPRPKRKPQADPKPREKDPAVDAIWSLQKHFPLAFPVNPAPKVPLKEGILKDAEQHLSLLGLTLEQLKLGISTWCRGTRYSASMVENAPRLDLNGQPAGVVTAAQARYAKQQASLRRTQHRKNRASQKQRVEPNVADDTVQQPDA
jgi:ProP effector